VHMIVRQRWWAGVRQRGVEADEGLRHVLSGRVCGGVCCGKGGGRIDYGTVLGIVWQGGERRCQSGGRLGLRWDIRHLCEQAVEAGVTPLVVLSCTHPTRTPSGEPRNVTRLIFDKR